jgi:hypothetical protein
MPHFHATAVFEAKGTSLEEVDRTAASVFRSLHYNRIHYYEHDVTAGGGPYPSSKTLYFSVIAEFDVDAGTEDKAGELAADALESLATDDVQFIAFGLTQGEQRVRPAERAPREEAEPERRQEARVEEGETEERKGKKRGSRGRGRKRKGEREGEAVYDEGVESAPVQAAEAGEPEIEAAEEAMTPAASAVVERPLVETPLEVLTTSIDKVEPETRPITYYIEPEEVSPPPRSSEAMHVTVAVSFRASELGFQPNGSGSIDREELLSRAVAEARSRHPELPTDVAPTHEVVIQPWGEVVLTLMWAYDVPVPSATEEA